VGTGPSTKALDRQVQAGMRSTNERDAKIAHSYRDGATLRELGRRYGITRDQVRYVLVRQGVPRRPALKPIPEHVSSVLRRRGRADPSATAFALRWLLLLARSPIPLTGVCAPSRSTVVAAASPVVGRA